MSHDKGVRAQNWLADYLRGWLPDAAAVGSGRRGADIENTPNLSFENKTQADFKPVAFMRQAAANAGRQIPIVTYWPPGIGKERVATILAITPRHRLERILWDATGAPEVIWEPTGAAGFDPAGFAKYPRADLGALRVVLYVPRGFKDPAAHLPILPLYRLMGLLELAGYVPARRTRAPLDVLA